MIMQVCWKDGMIDEWDYKKLTGEVEVLFSPPKYAFYGLWEPGSATVYCGTCDKKISINRASIRYAKRRLINHGRDEHGEKFYELIERQGAVHVKAKRLLYVDCPFCDQRLCPSPSDHSWIHHLKSHGFLDKYECHRVLAALLNSGKYSVD